MLSSAICNYMVLHTYGNHKNGKPGIARNKYQASYRIRYHTVWCSNNKVAFRDFYPIPFYQSHLWVWAFSMVKSATGTQPSFK